MSEVRIIRGVHPGGMPAMSDIRVKIGDVSLNLNRADFESLCSQISEQCAADAQAAGRVYDKHWERAKAVDEYVDGLRKLLLYQEPGMDWFLPLDREELDIEALHKYLEDHSEILGYR